jgi:hypothetical protein
MTNSRPNFDSAIAEATAARDQLQAEFDAVKNGYDTFRVIQLRGAMAEANRRLCELRSAKAADRPIEPRQSRAIFFGSNS